MAPRPPSKEKKKATVPTMDHLWKRVEKLEKITFSLGKEVKRFCDREYPGVPVRECVEKIRDEKDHELRMCDHVLSYIQGTLNKGMRHVKSGDLTLIDILTLADAERSLDSIVVQMTKIDNRDISSDDSQTEENVKHDTKDTKDTKDSNERMFIDCDGLDPLEISIGTQRVSPSWEFAIDLPAVDVPSSML